VPTTLDCDDSTGPDTEREANPHGAGAQGTETYTCTVRDQYGEPARDADPGTAGNQQITVKGENLNGINDPDSPDGQSFGTPDYTCNLPTTADGNGQCTRTVNQGEGEQGTAIICWWIGTGPEGNSICESEPTSEMQDASGADTANDLGDKTELTWEERRAAGLDIETESETLAVGATRTLEASIFDQFGDLFQSTTTVNLEFFNVSPTDRNQENNDKNTPGSPDASCTTNNDTTCTFEYSQTEIGGRDLICGWFSETPSMSGTSRNASGTCAGEQRADADDEEDTADAPLPAEDDVDLTETTWLDDPAATRVECSPETTNSVSTSAKRVTCTATTGEPESVVPGTEIDVEATGKNDPDRGNSRQTPDFTCTTGNQGKCTIVHGPGRGTRATGFTTYMAWADEDYEDSTDEADASEGRDEGSDAGGTAEPDTTDVVNHNWLSGDRTVSLKPSDRRVDRGDRVNLSGEINGPAKTCRAGERVILKSRPAGSKKPFKARGNPATTNDNGKFSFNRVRIWKDTEFMAVAGKNRGPCDWAASNEKTVRTT
jgi:hypothetical protein